MGHMMDGTHDVWDTLLCVLCLRWRTLFMFPGSYLSNYEHCYINKIKTVALINLKVNKHCDCQQISDTPGSYDG